MLATRLAGTTRCGLQGGSSLKNIDIDQIMDLLYKANCFRNDGMQNVYQYQDAQGIWKRQFPVECRRAINEVMVKMKGPVLHVVDLRQIQIELAEDQRFLEPKLAQQQPSQWIVTCDARVNLRYCNTSEHKRDGFEKMYLDFKFDPQAQLKKESVFYSFLKSSLDVEPVDAEGNLHPKVRLLLESTIYLLSEFQGAKKAFILLGAPHTGKSVWLNFLAMMVGEHAYAPLSLQDLGDRFRASCIENVHLVLTHEVRCSTLKNLNIVKGIISGDPTIIEAKGKQPKTIIPRVKLMLAANALPMLGETDVGGAFTERLSVLVFSSKSVEDRDPELLDKLYAERDLILSLAVQQAKNIIIHKLRFTEDPEGVRALESYQAEGNAVPSFLRENYLTDKDSKLYLLDVYEAFRSYCFANLLAYSNSRGFRQQIAQLGYGIAKARINPADNPRACIFGLKRKEISSDK